MALDDITYDPTPWNMVSEIPVGLLFAPVDILFDNLGAGESFILETVLNGPTYQETVIIMIS